MKVKELSLVVSGIVLGLGLSFSPQIYAATSSLLGAKVDKVMTVKLDNKTIGSAVVINGTSYLPVRATANAFKMEVAVDSKEIELTTGNEVGTEVPEVETPEVEKPKTREELAEIAKEELIEMNKESKRLDEVYKVQRGLINNIDKAKRTIAQMESSNTRTRTLERINKLEEIIANNPAPPDFLSQLEGYKADLAAFDKQLADAEANIPIWEKELADLLIAEPGLAIYDNK